MQSKQKTNAKQQQLSDAHEAMTATESLGKYVGFQSRYSHTRTDMYAVICDSAYASFFFAMVATWLCLLLDLAFGVLTFPHFSGTSHA